jgi:hypothetical protein
MVKSLMQRHEKWCNAAMKSSHAAATTKKGFNYGFWFGFIVNEKRGKQESLNHYRIITNVADQNALHEQSYNNYKVNFLEKRRNSAIKNCWALSNVDYEQPKQRSCHLIHICCLPAFTEETVENHHGKSKTCASANQTHLAWWRVFDFKSGYEHRINPIWIHDSSNIIHENRRW